MKRLLICLAAIAFWAVDQTELAAQSGSRGSYQSILSQSGLNGYSPSSNPGSYAPSYSQAIGGQNYLGNNGGFQTGSAVNQFGPNVGGGCSSCTGGGIPMNQGFQGQIVNGGAFGQGPIQGQGQLNSGVQGPAVQGAPMIQGPAIQGAPMIQGPALQQGAPLGQAPIADGAIGFGSGFAADTGFVSGPVFNNAPVFTPGNAFVGAAAVAAAPRRNRFFGLNGLVFNRDFEDDVFLTRDAVDNSLLSTDADTNTLGGLEFFAGSRGSNGNGFEARYWGLFNDQATASLTGGVYSTYITGLQDLIWPLTGEDLRTVVDRGTTNTIRRDNEIHNIEFNMLRRGGCFTTRNGRRGNFELLHGFRWFEFDEDFQWQVTSAAAPLDLFFNNEVSNTLLGYQIGSRANLCFGQRLSCNVGTKFGLFNNRARVRQNIVDGFGTFATVGPGGLDYNYSEAKNDVSALGELDLGVSRLMSQGSRLNIGYRAIGVSGIALAPSQFTNFKTIAAITDVQSNDSLLLHGAYFGFEFCR